MAVTALTALLASGSDLPLGRSVLVTLAVFTGQLTIGWSNDLLDAGRDLAARRLDKPLARGSVSRRTIVAALTLAMVGTIGLSFACGRQSGLLHLGAVVGSGWAYNVGLKATLWSFVPYAVAFGSLPAVVTLAALDPTLPPVWMICVGALLGVGAHLLNALPDIEDDLAAGVRGLPHRLSPWALRWSAVTTLLGATAIVGVWGIGSALPALVSLGIGGLAVAAAAGVVAGAGRTPFACAVALALLNVGALWITHL